MNVPVDVIDGLAPDAMPDAAALLAQLGQDDPRMAALCRFFVERQTQAAQEAAATCTAEPSDVAADTRAFDALEQRHARLRDIARDMHAELCVLRDRNAMLAAALGACETCFGRDTACPDCDGRGRPGADLPDGPMYARLVAPAVRRLMQARIPHRDARPSVPPDRAVDGPAVGPLD